MMAAPISPDYFLEHYKELLPRYVAKGHPSKDTLRMYECQIDIFIRWCGDHGRHPLAMTDYQLRIYREYLNQKEYRDDTIALKIISLRVFYAMAHKLKLISTNPCIDIDAPTAFTQDEMFNYYDMDQLAELCKAFEEEPNDFIRCRNTLILHLMAIEGLRNVEVHRANYEDINWDVKAIMIHGKGHDNPIYPCRETFDVLNKYLDTFTLPEVKHGPTPLILSHSNNNRQGRISRNGLRYIMNVALEYTGMKKSGSSCHVMRHSCGTNLYAATKDLRVVQETLRQRDPRMAARYAHVNDRIANRITSKLALKFHE
jgi:site-specific recombinase XerD